VSDAAPVLDPGATIGILGGGQLGRMLAQAAARLGFKCHVFAPNPESPAFDVVHRVTCADYTDTQALDRFAADVDLVTYEFENVPAETAAFLAARLPVRPDPNVLAITQDRLAEKNFVSGLGIATAAFAAADGPADLTPALKETGLPAVLKTRRLGYDGKGQAMIREPQSAEAAWRAVGAQPSILEAFVPFACEVSVVAARSHDGSVECFDVTENEHQNHILKMSRVPARVSAEAADTARGIAEKIAQEFDYVGVLAVEMFVLGDGSRAGQRDRATRPQFRALDARRSVGLAIRAAHPRGGRLAARQAGAPRPRRNDQSHRRRGQRFSQVAASSRRRRASLRQVGDPPRAQDGARHPRLH
jgi:5-(carboxyamino)imidazole ribonucleotide synthase